MSLSRHKGDNITLCLTFNMYSFQSTTPYLLNSMANENFVINAVIYKSRGTKDQNEHTDITRSLLLSIRLCTLAILVALLTLHLRSVRVFRWEQSVSGGLLITYLIAVVGLALCAGNPVSLKKGVVLQTYLSGTGAALLALNAACLWRRWHHAADLTRAVADLLSALGVPLQQQVTN